ncbi:MAG: Cytochrome [Pseudomonadota bacterium]
MANERLPLSASACPWEQADTAFPFARVSPFDPPPQYARARAQQPVLPVQLWNGERAWVLTRQADIRAVLADDERFSGRFAQAGFPTVTEARVAVDRDERAFVGMDNPEHDRFRRMFTQEFSVRRMRALEPQITSIAEQLVADMVQAGSPQDLVERLAVPFPSLVMSLLFGSPFEDHRFIITCAAARHGLTQTPGEAQSRARQLADYVRALIRERETQPRDDMVSRIIAEHVRPGHLSVDEFAEIGAMILRAGHDTTTNMIGMGTLLLLRDAALMRRLIEQPQAIAAAVEELLRFISPVQFSPRRVARVDVEIGGVLIRAGEGLFLSLASANRDEAVFDQPDRLDIDRAMGRHLTFGFGIHQCLGQVLARIELQVLWGVLLRRLPELALDVAIEQIRFKHDMQIYGVHNLPVRWPQAKA